MLWLWFLHLWHKQLHYVFFVVLFDSIFCVVRFVSFALLFHNNTSACTLLDVVSIYTHICLCAATRCAVVVVALHALLAILNAFCYTTCSYCVVLFQIEIQQQPNVFVFHFSHLKSVVVVVREIAFLCSIKWKNVLLQIPFPFFFSFFFHWKFEFWCETILFSASNSLLFEQVCWVSQCRSD